MNFHVDAKNNFVKYNLM